MTVWSREAVLEAIRRFAARNGFQPVSDEANAHNELPSSETVARLFGSWNAGIRAAGFEPYPARSSTLAKRLARRDRDEGYVGAIRAARRRIEDAA